MKLIFFSLITTAGKYIVVGLVKSVCKINKNTSFILLKMLMLIILISVEDARCSCINN